MKKNAFTLIELLAVIVILAIIAIIAVPIVINIIGDSKDESIKRSVKHYLDTVTNIITKENIKAKYNADECIIQEDGNIICSENGNELTTSNGTNKLEISMKGKKPGSGTIKLQNGKIIDIIDIYLEGKYANYDENNNVIFYLYAIPKEAGLYDENRKPLATWDELVNIYNLKITNDYTTSTYSEKNSGSMYDILTNNTNLENATTLIIANNGINNKIGNYVFYNCKKLTRIVISSSVTSIGDYAFKNCKGLTSITIPSSVTNIGNQAFVESGLISAVFEKTNNWRVKGYMSTDGFVLPFETNGWISVDITTPQDNANRLTKTYCACKWKRN